ncbi:hypothetical protein I302_103099 [Kwoniella bestiolae CBS 10118]|uniref:Uncharacterized protein n=1 Tax=Kwoniella bestiolae CBS 10118 TaxID=1296100 RepID=A0A1B9GGV3_9TREE|nr:hypothetical protein I302_01799 [Kwoniella bestiolae CBS 10118]OCF30280.1 hypothetical protein I302_01799 [Kwoniella bestiolae CBS 10118]
MLSRSYKAIVIGAGPGGLATMKSLLDVGLNKICWIDKNFKGGRLNELYREISSNTKVGIYLDAVHASPTCQRIIESTPSPNAITGLEKIDRDETCQLSLAGDMIEMLQRGILKDKGVEKVQAEVKEISLEGSTWSIGLHNHPSPLTSPRLFLCTGSHPLTPKFHTPYNPHLKVLDLDRCMIKSTLPSLFPRDQKSVVGVIGNSHSGVLVCRNLYEIQKEQQRDLRIINFKRSEIRYAIYREDGIVYDNTGLKGDTADWSKDHMDNPSTDVREVIEQVDISHNAEEVYKKRLGECTHLIYAVGYEANPYPRITIDGKEVKQDDLTFDQQTSEFSLSGKKVKGLYGLGIAHPERSHDPEGNEENNVGLAKFFKFGETCQELWKKE